MIQQWYYVTRFYKFLTESKWSLDIWQKIWLASASSFMRSILINNWKWACSFFWKWACGLVPTGQLPHQKTCMLFATAQYTFSLPVSDKPLMANFHTVTSKPWVNGNCPIKEWSHVFRMFSGFAYKQDA